MYPRPKIPETLVLQVGPQVWNQATRTWNTGSMRTSPDLLRAIVFSSAPACAGCYALICTWDSSITLNGRLLGDPSPWRALHGVGVLGVELRPKCPRHPSLPPGHVAAWPEPWAGEPFGQTKLWYSASSALKWKLNESEFIKTVIKGCLETPRNLSKVGRPGGVTEEEQHRGQEAFPINGLFLLPQVGPTPWTPCTEQDAKAQKNLVQGCGAHSICSKTPAETSVSRVSEYLTSFRKQSA